MVQSVLVIMALSQVSGGEPPLLGAALSATRTISSRPLDGHELLKIGDIHEVQNHLQEALPYYERALTAFQAKKDRSGEAMALLRIGGILERKGEADQAFAALTAAVSLLHVEKKDGLHGRAWLKLGQVAETLGRHSEAADALHRAETLLRRAGDRQGRMESRLRLAGLHVSHDRMDEGLELLLSVLRDAEQRRDFSQQLDALMLIARVHEQARHPVKAVEAYEGALRIAVSQRSARSEAQCRARLAVLALATERYEEGRMMAQKALGLYQSLRDRSGEADMLSLLGNLYTAEGHVPLALEHHERALALYRALRHRLREAGAQANLAVAYEALGAPEEVHDAQSKVVSLLLFAE